MPQMTLRDRDIRNEVKRILDATNAYDQVSLGRMEGSEAAEDLRLVEVSPLKEVYSDEFDDDVKGSQLVDATMEIRLTAKHQDEQSRDELAELMRNNALNTLQSLSILGITMPAWQKFNSAVWLPSVPPERTVVLTLAYRYMPESSSSYDTTE